MSHNHSVKENSSQIFGIAALGAVIGAGITILFAPKSGNQARADLKNKVKSMKAKTSNYKSEINDAVENAEEIARRSKKTTDTGSEKVTKSKVVKPKKPDSAK